MCKIFLSYSRKDYDVVRRIKQEIEQATKAKCWMDLDGISYKSPDFTKIIAPAIEQASIFVFILTPNSQESRFARNELLLAKARNKHIFFVEPCKCEMTSEFILEYGHHNINQYYINYHRQKLYEEIAGLLPQGFKEQSDTGQTQKSIITIGTVDVDDTNLQKAKSYFDNKLYIEAFRLFELAAEQGSPEAVSIINAGKQQILKEHIDADEEKDVDIEWENRMPLKPDQEWPEKTAITGDNYLVDLGYAKFNMIQVEGGELLLGATPEVTCSKEVKIVKIPSIYRPRKRFSEGLMLVENPEHKFGYLNDSLEEVIPCQYCNGGAFVNGIAPVYNNEKWGAIDTRGNIVHPFQYGNMYSIPNYKPVSRPKNEPFFIKNGRVIDKWNNEYNFFHGIPLLANNNDIYYLDQGVITCYTLERDLKGIWHDTIKFKKEGFTKRNGFRKEGFYQFYNHLAIICKNEKYGIINLSLDEIVPCEFEQICDFDLDSENTVACDSKGNFYHIKVKKK